MSMLPAYSRIRRTFACVCLILGAMLAVGAASALAAPATPTLTVETLVPGGPTPASSATIHGILSPGTPGEAGSLYQFHYKEFKEGETPDCEGGLSAPESPGIAIGEENEAVTETLSSLQSGTKYAVCLRVENLTAQVAKSTTEHFTTAITPETPFAEQVKAGSITATTVEVQGELNHLKVGEPGTFEVLYKVSPFSEPPTGECEENTTSPAQSTSGVMDEKVSEILENLEPNAKYTFCLRVHNEAGEVATGAPVTFTTAAIPPKVESESAAGLTAEKAELKATINPENQETTCKFEYSTSPSLAGATTVSCFKALNGVFESVGLSVPVSGLVPASTYYYRVDATNATGETKDATIGEFKTLATLTPLVVTESTYSTKVSSTSTTLAAEVNPEGSPTTYRFETSTGGGPFAPAPGGEGSVGEGLAAVPVSVQLTSLSPLTAYRYRVVAENAAKERAEGPELTFTTQPAGGDFALPDNRAWELVSPPDKDGSGIYGMRESGVIQAAENGEGIAYIAAGPISPGGHEPSGNLAYAFTQILSKRLLAGGWETQDIQTPRNPANEYGGVHTGTPGEYVMFSSDLSLGLLEPNAVEGPNAGTPLPPLPQTAEESVYLRDDEDGAYQALVTAENVFEGAHSPFGKQVGRGGSTNASEGVIPLIGTPDLSHVVLGSLQVPLLEGAASPGLYEWTAGEPATEPLKPVNVLPGPDGKSTEAVLGRGNDLLRHAISEDGERVIWNALGGSDGRPGEVETVLYMRDTDKGETVQVSTGQAFYQTASNDGSRVFYTEAGQLYAFTAPVSEGPLSGGATDLTEGITVQGDVIGASENGEYVYLVTDGALSPSENAGKTVAGAKNENAHGQKPEGEHNLYVIHYEHDQWKPTFIANLSGADTPDWDGNGRVADVDGLAGVNLTGLTARVSPDGSHLAFMSEERVTGYDNTDAVSHAADEEVYVYDAQSNRTVCASCNPTGERPTGVFDPSGELISSRPLLVDNPHVWEGHWLAASVPGWTAQDDNSALYQSRYLADDGRLFFDSPDPLVPADVNGKENVYEYAPEGLGGCTSSTENPADLYSPQAAGCVGLISSGASGEESAFLDAGAMGEGGQEAEDVFFITSSKLAPQDTDSAYDVYDAHICSTQVPCPPSATSVPPACTTADSCRAAPTPQPEVFGAPSSQTVTGNGNLIGGRELNPPVVPKTVTKKPVTCKKGFVKKKVRSKQVCVKKPKNKRKAKKSSKSSRGGKS